jgi:hypothetical protein
MEFSAMLRRSLWCMLTGFLIAVPILLAAYAAQTDWPPHKIVLIAVVTVASAGITALVDELVLDRRRAHPTARASQGRVRPERVSASTALRQAPRWP